MPKQHNLLGYYVRVEPDNWLHREDKGEELKLCKSLIADIKRHVDGIRSIGFECETENVCEYCGAAWTEDSDVFNGGCCDEDLEHDPGQESQQEATDEADQ